MPPLPPSTFARTFRWQWPATQRALLADLWAARGFETRLDDDGLVVAERDGETVTIGVVGPLALSPPDADVLIATGPLSGRAGSATSATDAELLTPADVHELLLYGVDREDGNRIAHAHLDTDLTVPPSEPDSGPDYSRAVVLVTVVVAIGAVVAISGVGGPLAEERAEQFPTPEPADQAPTEDGSSSVSTATDDSADAYPDGLTGSGVRNASELAAAHRKAVENRERRVETRYRGPGNTTTLPGIVEHEVTSYFHSSGRFNTTFQVVELRNESRANRTVRYWADGSQRHRQVETETNSSYSRTPLSGRSIVVAVEAFVDRIYLGALTANETSVETVRQSGVTVHRIVAAGDPEGYRDNVTDFRAIASITPEGRLIRLRVEYTHAPTGEPVVIEVEYGKIDEVPPPPRPEWVDERTG
ncbi:hypothetical protein [Haloparvum sp. AD34]